LPRSGSDAAVASGGFSPPPAIFDDDAHEARSEDEERSAADQPRRLGEIGPSHGALKDEHGTRRQEHQSQKNDEFIAHETLGSFEKLGRGSVQPQVFVGFGSDCNQCLKFRTFGSETSPSEG
jgi:hypothetical protein